MFKLTALIAVLTVFGVYVFRTLRTRQRYRLPPRVPGIPILGNSLQAGSKDRARWAIKAAQEHGEMFTCKFGSNTWVFMNSSRVITDLLEKRAGIYSSRPNWPYIDRLLSGGCRIVFMQYGDRWRKTRKIMHSILNTRQIDTYKPFQDLESKQLLLDYLDHPDQWYFAHVRFANSVIMSAVLGRRTDMDDPIIRKILAAMKLVVDNVRPGACLVDEFPWLDDILPHAMQWWRPKGEQIFESTQSVYREMLAEFKDRDEQGLQPQCFAEEFLRETKAEEFSESETLFSLASLIEAGSDTSRITINSIVAAAAKFPDWVQRARQQLDKVCGANAERLPDFSDRAELPYITAVVKEGLRWTPILAELGLPHALTEDDEYEGYKFPAGTIFTWNAWAIARSPGENPQPHRFWPERHLNDSLDQPLKGHWSFGAGRRVCVGYNLGFTNAWIAIARLIMCFDFEQDPNMPIDELTIVQNESSRAPFAICITPRSEAHVRLIRTECGNP